MAGCPEGPRKKPQGPRKKQVQGRSIWFFSVITLITHSTCKMNLNSLTFLALHCVLTGKESPSVPAESSRYSLLFNKRQLNTCRLHTFCFLTRNFPLPGWSPSKHLPPIYWGFFVVKCRGIIYLAQLLHKSTDPQSISRKRREEIETGRPAVRSLAQICALAVN